MIKINGHDSGKSSSNVLWSKIKEALNDASFDLRTFSGLSRDLEVRREIIEETVRQHNQEIRFSGVRAKNGEPLFTLASRPKNWRERVSRVRHIFASIG